MYTQKDFVPEFFFSAEEGMQKHRATLKTLIGQEIKEVYLVWDLDEDNWFSDAPVIVMVGERQLELLASHMERYSISFNALDMKLRPTWFLDDDQSIEDADFDLEWRPNCLPEINCIVEGIIENFVFVEYTFSSTVIDDKTNPQNVGKTSKSAWLMNAIEIHTSKGVLTVFNALDTNGLENKSAVGKEYRCLALV